MRTLFFLLFLLPSVSFAQDINPPVTLDAIYQQIEAKKLDVETRSDFRGSLLKAARQSVRSGQLSRRDHLRIVVAAFTPGTRKIMEDMAVLQMASSGDDVPLNETGVIDRERISWADLTEFLTKLIPFILELLERFGG